ncbi:hypothetical protein [Flavobacterium sp.]|jgi:hypothetical protein|uniref:hypothetical protein n=1 Tax=Flavobacterium sp. TaxID=239 RepID=UPI0037BF8015
MMKELDLLKKDWKKDTNSFEQLSESAIYKMIHKHSSSLVKWILIISILEFIVLNGIGFFINDENIDKFLALHPYLNIINYLNYIVVIGFIIVFYKKYRAISALDSSKNLIEQIINTRKVVNYYILWNVLIGGFFGVFGAIDGFNNAYSKDHAVNRTTEYLVIIFIVPLIMVLIWGFYKLLYGSLLSKLNKNYKELMKIDL